MLNGLDLFSGIGGISYALSKWVQPVAYCEVDRYCQAILQSRIETGDLADAPIWDDVTTLDGRQFRGAVDIIYGGFPCQDISVAGHGVGLEGERSGLFFEIVRLAEEIEPAFLFLENVPAIRLRGLDRVGQELARLGYDCRWGTLSAFDVGASHKRDRWWLLAHANRIGRRDQPIAGTQFKSATHANDNGQTQPLADTACIRRREGFAESTGQQGRLNSTFGSASVANAHRQHDQPLSRSLGSPQGPTGQQIGRNGPDDCGSNVANASGSRRERPSGGGDEGTWRQACRPSGSSWWEVEPDVGRVVDGLPQRVDRLHALGNGVVPQCVAEAFQRLMGL